MLKLATITNTQHHIYKSKKIDENFSSEVSSFSLKKFQAISNESISTKLSFTEIAEKYDGFIFFTLHVNAHNLKLLKEIKNKGKLIVAIQETHQFSMHSGVINNLILQADLVIAASKIEESYLKKLVNFEISTVLSFGWPFNENKILNQTNDPLKKINMLVLSAPNSVTASSYEDTKFRVALINTIINDFPDHELSIKTHPAEDVNIFNKIINSYPLKDKNIKLIEDQNEYSKNINLANKIFVSNRTQAAVDLIETEKLTVYVIGKDNYFSTTVRNKNNVYKKNDIEFLELNNAKIINSFKINFFGEEENYFRNLEKKILSLESNQLNAFQDEYLLWGFIFSNVSKKRLKKNASPQLRLTLNKIFDEKENYLLKINGCNGISIDTAIFIIYMRKILTKNVNDYDIVDNINSFFTKWFVQYFPIEAILIYYSIARLNISISFQPDVEDLVIESEKHLKSKSKIFSFLIWLLKIQITGKSNAYKSAIFFSTKRFIQGVAYSKYL